LVFKLLPVTEEWKKQKKQRRLGAFHFFVD